MAANEDEFAVEGRLLVIEHAPPVIDNTNFVGFTEFRLVRTRAVQE